MFLQSALCCCSGRQPRIMQRRSQSSSYMRRRSRRSSRSSRLVQVAANTPPNHPRQVPAPLRLHAGRHCHRRISTRKAGNCACREGSAFMRTLSINAIKDTTGMWEHCRGPGSCILPAFLPLLCFSGPGRKPLSSATRPATPMRQSWQTSSTTIEPL